MELSITINNSNGGVVNIYSDPSSLVSHANVSHAKDVLLSRLYYARNKTSVGGYSAWTSLLDNYYQGNYQEMFNYITSLKGNGGHTRKICLECLQTLIDNQ